MRKNKNSEELLASVYNHRGYINYYLFFDKEAESDYLNAYRLRVHDIFPIDLAVTYKGLCDSYYKMVEQAVKKKQKLIFLKMALINLDKGLEMRQKLENIIYDLRKN